MASRPPLAPLLRVQGIQLAVGGVNVLRDVGFALGEGSLTGLIGPNGAGKTSLFDVLTGLRLPGSGSVRLGDQELLGLPPHRIAEVGIARTFQEARLFEAWSALDNLLAAMHLRHPYGVLDAVLRTPRMQTAEVATQADAYALLDRFGLRAQAGTLAGALPEGARRRLEIARALASDPALLLLDEPVAGLPPRETADLLAVIRELRGAGHAVMLSGHDMGLVMELCEQVLVLNAGALIAQGDPEEVRGNAAVTQAYRGLEVPDS